MRNIREAADRARECFDDEMINGSGHGPVEFEIELRAWITADNRDHAIELLVKAFKEDEGVLEWTLDSIDEPKELLK